MTPLLQVALGGALGASLRHLSVAQATAWLGAGFPFGTLIVNVVGSFIMGLAAHLLVRDGAILPVAPLVMTGILGGFTTFSAYSLDAVRLYENGQPGAAFAYVIGSVLLSITALVLGLLLARALA